MEKNNFQTESQKIIRKRINKIKIRRGYISSLSQVLLLVIFFYFLFGKFLLISQMEGMSMFPFINDGDLVIGYRYASKYRVDDVVYYTKDNSTHIGRIVGVENDNVEITKEGELLVNGRTTSDKTLFLTFSKDRSDFSISIPKNGFFMLNDYRSDVSDSRTHGLVHKVHIKAKVISIFRRRNV